MHELSITRNVVAIVSEAGGWAKGDARPVGNRSPAPGRRARTPIRFCFDICAQGTPLAGGRAWKIIEIAGRGLCSACGEESKAVSRDVPPAEPLAGA